MKHNFLSVIALVACTLLIVSCNQNPVELQKVNKTVLTGKAQKGPLAIGSKVSIFELDEEFGQTGKVFTTTIVDNDGSFEQRNMQLNSQYVELTAEGYYFNEVKGRIEQSALTLTALSDISDVSNVNINILTTIERPRILYLIEKESMSFQDARLKAHAEVMEIFGMNENSNQNSEQLSINNNAQLLVISSIVMGLRPTSDVTSLITSIATDIQKDGILDDDDIKSQLRTNFIGLNVADLYANLSKQRISVDYTQEEIQNGLALFDEVSRDYSLESIEYPVTGSYGDNILAMADGEEVNVGEYSFAAVNVWAPLKIVVTSNDIEWYMNIIKNNWDWTKYVSGSGDTPNSQVFTVTDPNQKSDLQFIVEQPGSLTFTFYEFGSSVPTQQKTLLFVKK